MGIQVRFDVPIPPGEVTGGAFRKGSIVKHRGYELPVLGLRWFVLPPHTEFDVGRRIVTGVFVPTFGRVPVSDVELVRL